MLIARIKIEGFGNKEIDKYIGFENTDIYAKMSIFLL